jgi:hypothetical protein
VLIFAAVDRGILAAAPFDPQPADRNQGLLGSKFWEDNDEHRLLAACRAGNDGGVR